MGDHLPRTTPFVVDTKPFIVNDWLEFDIELPVRAATGTVVLHLSLMIASEPATAFKRTVLVEYVKPLAIVLVPSRAPSTGGEIVTIQLSEFHSCGNIYRCNGHLWGSDGSDTCCSQYRHDPSTSPGDANLPKVGNFFKTGSISDP